MEKLSKHVAFSGHRRLFDLVVLGEQQEELHEVLRSLAECSGAQFVAFMEEHVERWYEVGVRVRFKIFSSYEDGLVVQW